MAQTLDKSREKPLETSQEMPLLSGTSSPQALNLPPTIVFAPAPTVLAPAPTVLAPAPTVLTNHTVPSKLILIADRPAPLTRPRRRFRMEQYEITIISLMLICAALCFYRLMWAIQP